MPIVFQCFAESGPLAEHPGPEGIIAAWWPVLVVAFAVALLMTPLCRRFALARRIVDRPDDYLKPHQTPTPYLGGVAIFLGWAAGLAVACWLASGADGLRSAGILGNRTLTVGVVTAATLSMVVGLLDDIYHLAPVGRLCATVLLGVVLIACGLGDDFVPALALQLSADFVPEGTLWGLALTAPVTLFIVLGACNATNVLDGLDGLCAGVLGITFAGFMGLCWLVGTTELGWAVVLPGVVPALAAMGAALGYLPYNRPPATIFMGDAGSLFLGMNAAILLLCFAETASPRLVLAALLVFALPIADMFLAMVRRRRAGKPMMEGDRSHFYDQLIDRGHSVWRVNAIAYLLAAAYALLGLVAASLSDAQAGMLCGGVVVATSAAAVGTGMTRPESAAARDGAGSAVNGPDEA